jgi:hypothetical protein
LGSKASGASAGSGQDVPHNASAEQIAALRRKSTTCSVQEAMVSFGAGEEIAYLQVARPNGVTSDGRDEFFAEIKSVVNNTEGAPETEIGDIRKTLVVMTKDTTQRTLSFGYDRVLVSGSSEPQLVQLIVQRTGGSHNTASCQWRTERLSAVPGFGYTEAEGTLHFDEGITELFIEIEILPRSTTAARDEFLLILSEADGADFHANSDGGAEEEILTIEVGPTDLINSHFSQKMVMWFDTKFNFDEFRLGNAEFKDQVLSALYCNGSYEEQKEAELSDWIFHFIALPWKLIFMLVPPPAYCGGWVCFTTCLVLIGVLTALIGDLAELFGCVVDIPDLLTAISFVALGTSMPDLFASRSAAINDPTADASIVNVTGSNCVNVFLGLGLPWTIGAIYWKVKLWDLEWADKYQDIASEHDNTVLFVVRSGDLAISVLIFCVCAVFAMVILFVRRRTLGGELGGPLSLKISSCVAFASMWFLYISLSFWWSLRKDIATDTERAIVAATSATCLLVPFLVFLIMARRTTWLPTPTDSSRTSIGSDQALENSAEEEHPPSAKAGFPEKQPTIRRSKSSASVNSLPMSIASEKSDNKYAVGSVPASFLQWQNQAVAPPPFAGTKTLLDDNVSVGSEKHSSGKVTPYTSEASSTVKFCEDV